MWQLVAGDTLVPRTPAASQPSAPSQPPAPVTSSPGSSQPPNSGPLCSGGLEQIPSSGKWENKGPASWVVMRVNEIFSA